MYTFMQNCSHIYMHRLLALLNTILLPGTAHQFVHRAMTKARKYTAHAILYFTVPYYSTLYFRILSLHTSYLIYVYIYIYVYIHIFLHVQYM